MKINIPGTSKFIFLRAKIVDVDNSVIGLNSGKSRNTNHYILMDYDNLLDYSGLHDELFEIMKAYGLKRAMIIESSPGKYHVVSFTPQSFANIMKIMSESTCDKNQLAHTAKYGYSTIRFTAKHGFTPKVKEILRNDDGTNFYDFEAENAYVELLGGFE